MDFIIRQMPSMTEDGPNHGDMGNAGDMGNGTHSDHMMSPYLFTRASSFFVLFEGAFIESTGAFIGALALSFAFALLATFASEAIRLRERDALLAKNPVFRLMGGLLHAFRQLLHYSAMLLVMTMNVWIIIAVVAGHAVGWAVYAIVFGPGLSEGQVKASVAECHC